MLSASLRHCCSWGAFPQVLESPVGSMLLAFSRSKPSQASPNPSPATNLMLTVMCGGTHPPRMRHSKKHHKPRHGLKPFLLWPWLSPKIHAWHARVTTLFFFSFSVCTELSNLPPILLFRIPFGCIVLRGAGCIRSRSTSRKFLS